MYDNEPITIVYQSCAAALMKIGLFYNQASVSVQEGAENAQSITVAALLRTAVVIGRDGSLSDRHIIYRCGMLENAEPIQQKSKYKQDDESDNDCSQEGARLFEGPLPGRLCRENVFYGNADVLT